jgi:hypothetical protein
MANKYVAAVAGGAVGAITLAILHQIVKRITPSAPRLDNLAKQGLRKTIRAAGAGQPEDGKLYWGSLAGDLAANTGYYAVALAFGPGPAKWLGPVLGAGAGVGSVILPGPLGLDASETSRTEMTKALAIALYFAGGVAASATYHALTGETPERKHEPGQVEVPA